MSRVASQASFFKGSSVEESRVTVSRMGYESAECQKLYKEISDLRAEIVNIR